MIKDLFMNDDKPRYAAHWPSSHFLQDGRLVDLGHGHGPSARDLLTLWRHRRVKRRLLRSIATVLMLGGSIAAVVFSLTAVFGYTLGNAFRETIRPHFSEYASIATSVATVLLTTGLLFVTWRYARLTEVMLGEMRLARQHEGEPQLSLIVWSWLQPKEAPEVVDDYVTNVFIRNVGRVPALHPALHYDFVMWSGRKHTSGVCSIGPDDAPSILLPGADAVVRWGCKQSQIDDWRKQEESGEPFVVFRLVYRDPGNRLCSVTQDYTLQAVDERLFMLDRQFEFVATPSAPRWRSAED